ncbi:alpha-ketoglutarate-dependent dioxygenase AlkB [Geomonas sp. RF6]|uniref:alpha-ketoglutarate-dependent dioxygenase AlkB n=1 Tax=Geomonas sp. RF6 TaxID=2897342 RepID=UPI001E2AFF29|nr:alpha-ketoglutarate-dependent dioxygenase AlkB [Geomonas sp. RF6]UFS70984.1 alpha-ketoglutarate-dependent dioxygenase AlkB [Geomonas sp. RF6]
MKTRSEKGGELPEGFLYQEDFLSEEEEQRLLRIFTELPFETFEYKGFQAKRRVLAYGWTYDFNTNKLSRAVEIPAFLLPLRERAALPAGVAADDFVEALLTEYGAGAQINWHRDLTIFGKIAGISLGSSCTFRFKPSDKEGAAVSVVLAPRSLYVMEGVARWQYQHSIPPVKELRYSITFRTLR